MQYHSAILHFLFFIFIFEENIEAGKAAEVCMVCITPFLNLLVNGRTPIYSTSNVRLNSSLTSCHV
jgi:EamA domain-containing membrane protein RarD